METFIGHDSPETAFLVESYPYSFRLRCQIRYWLEYKKGHGYRLCSQTSNPKRPGLVWNKPKGSIYHPLMVMYLNDEGHVKVDSLPIYANEDTINAFVERYAAALTGARERTILNVLRAAAQATAAKRAARTTPLCLALALAAALALSAPGLALADCVTNTVFTSNGKLIFCTTCCSGSHCTTTCI